MKILNIVGARPNFMKAAPMMKEYAKHSSVQALLVHTGQHYDFNMSDIFFKDLEMPSPGYNLGVGSGSHALQTAKVMIELEKLFLKEKPDLVVVYGDVNSTLAGAVVAAKMGIKLAHIEAGLRSFDRTMPEEVNRIVADRLSDVNFCPTAKAVENLKKEGLKGILVGDLMYDAFLEYSKLAEKKPMLRGLKPKSYYLLTMHRAGNTDDKEKLAGLLKAVNGLGEKIIFPCHPRTSKMLKEFNIKPGKNIIVIEPQSYLSMLKLLMNSKILLTDSGGMQKEAYFAKIPCITLRENTEWTETLGEGNELLGKDHGKLKGLVEKQLKAKYKFDKQFYGDGKAARKIVEILLKE
jgi:UDP-GlcNAc3NAcA epimerase